MHRYAILFALFAGLFTGCSPEAVRTRQWKRYVQELKDAPPVPPDTATGQYAPAPELEVLDGLLRKYPGRQLTRTVVKTETVEVPGKTVYVEVKVKPDTVRNRSARDSLFARLQALVHQERADSELRAEVARLRSETLRLLNARACLPDTTIRSPDGAWRITFKRGAGGRYGVTWQDADKTFAYDQHVSEQRNERVVFEQRVWWRDEWFYSTLTMTLVAGWLGFVRLRDAKPASK